MHIARFFSAIILVIGSAAASSRLDVIDLPVGFFPEGITNGDEWIAYVGSLEDGSIWKGDLSTGEGEVVVSDANSTAVGLDHDRRSGYLYVVGGSAGELHVYDDETWDLVVTYNLSVGESTFLNDIIVTKTAAYITDSFQAQLYMVPLNSDDGEFVDPDEPATVIPLDGFPMVEGEFNANGIVSSRDDSMLIIANMQAGTLHKFDPETSAVTTIDLGGEAVHGDGLVLRENTLWVIENSVYSDMQIREISLSADFTCGFVSPVILKSDLFDDPTTAMRKGNSLYVVQAKFSVAEEDIETTPYEIVRVDRDEGEYICTTE